MTDYQALVDALALKAKNEALADTGMIGAGLLLELLSMFPAEHGVLIEIDGEQREPGDLGSYRGYYTDLAFDLDGNRTIGEVTAQLERRLGGDAYYGYKGGEFRANPGTLVWASPYGEYTGHGVTGVVGITGNVVITTAKVD